MFKIANVLVYYSIKCFRGCIEWAFNDDWRFQILASRSALSHQFLEPCNFGPNPNTPKVSVLVHVVTALLEQFGGRNYQVNHLAGN